MLNFFRGNDSVFIENLYGLHSSEVYNIAFRYCKNKADAEDCLQEVFVRALSKIGILRKHPHPDRWLFVTARLVSLEKIRANSKTYRVELNIDDFESILQSETFEDKLFEQDYTETEISLLRDSIFGKLNDKERELYILRYVDKLNVDVISGQLNISYSNATTRLNRLKKKIRSLVAKLFCD